MHYDPAKHTLTVVYRHNRGTYCYFNVPPEEWNAFQSAPSKGTYLNRVFKAHGYRYEQVEEPARQSNIRQQLSASVHKEGD